MATEGRVKGYVVGKDSVDGVLTWKARVTDEMSAHYGEKLFVASIHGGIELVQGLEVTFLVGSFTGRNKEIYFKAIDVMVPKAILKCDFCGATAELVVEVSTHEKDGPAEYWRTCLSDIVRAITQGQSSPTVTAKTKQFRLITIPEDGRGWRKMNGVF